MFTTFPVDRLIASAGLFAIFAGILAFIWVMFWALFPLTLSRRAKVLIVSALGLLDAGMVFVSSPFGLDELELICYKELFKMPRIANSTNFQIGEHLDFWTMSSSWLVFTGLPYKYPKVRFGATFIQDGRRHKASIECVFEPIPQSGEPLKVRFQELRMGVESVADGNRWAPYWPPK